MIQCKPWFFLVLLTLCPCLGVCAPPAANEVFQFTVKPLDPNTFTLHWHIKPGYFLYSKRIKLTETPDSNFVLGPLRFPPPEKKMTQQGITYTVYRDNLTLPIALLGKQAGEGLVNLSYQGCANDGFCYPPQSVLIKLTLNDKLELTQVAIEEDALSKANGPAAKSDTQALFAGHTWGMIIVSFFGFGLLLAFTPCVLPMVPVLSGIIVGHGKNLTTTKAFFLSLSYVLSMSVTYAIVGALVASMGSNLQIIMQSPWAISLFSLIFVLLALSMFDVYELRMPVAWQAKLASVTRSQQSGHYMSAALMGCLSTLILSPCVTAPLIGALGYIAQTGNMFLGTLALFFLGLGMGTPLLLIGASAGKLLPKAGHWMNAVKGFFGVILLAVAIYLLQRILPAHFIMGLWGSLCIGCAVFLGVFDKAFTKRDKFRQCIGILLFLYGILLSVGAGQGNGNPLQPLSSSKLMPDLTYNTPAIGGKTVAEVQQAISEANAQGKPVMVDFYADWCTSCQEMEATTLQDPRIRVALNDFVIIKVDITENNADNRALLHYFNVVAPPTFLFFDTKGQELTDLRVVGEASASVFFDKLDKIITMQG